MEKSTAEKPHKYYALKAYREPGGKKSHDNEINAFRKLKRTGLDNTHMIGYYCSYVHKSLHYALFEYADVGSLEDFIKDRSPPQTNDEITTFWNGMLHVIDGIVLIHDPPSSSDSSSGSSDFTA
jgi:serine/threonine protein kinase